MLPSVKPLPPKLWSNTNNSGLGVLPPSHEGSAATVNRVVFNFVIRVLRLSDVRCTLACSHAAADATAYVPDVASCLEHDGGCVHLTA